MRTIYEVYLISLFPCALSRIIIVKCYNYKTLLLICKITV
nr:MAG TPA: hypothetical protein [Caudoviricetes sp.]